MARLVGGEGETMSEDAVSIAGLERSFAAVRSAARSHADGGARVAASGAGAARAGEVAGKPRPRARNRNAERSIRLLEEAFVQLLAEKPYDKITVTDVTRRADLNRGTFYAHFSSIEALMNQLMDSLAETLSNLVEQVMDLSFVEDPMPVLQQISGFIQDNRDLVQKLMESQSLSAFTGPLKGRVRSQIKDFLVRQYADNAARTLMVADYISSGLLGTYSSWINGEYGDIGIDEINAGLAGLVSGASKVLAGECGVVDAVVR